VVVGRGGGGEDHARARRGQLKEGGGAEKEGWCGECGGVKDKQKTTSTALHCSNKQMDEASALPQYEA